MAELKEQVQTQFGPEEIKAALDLGERTNLSLDAKAVELFELLGDPLLSAEDVAVLLKGGTTTSQALDALAQGVEREVLERDDSTQRPLDPEGVVLFRRAGVEFEMLRLTALETQLGGGQSLFQFSMEGRLVRSIARIDRLDAIQGTGNQRQEIRAHVERIANGIKEGSEVPSAILLVINDGNIFRTDSAGEDDSPKPSDVIIDAITEFGEVKTPGSDSGVPAQVARLVDISIPYRPAAFDEEKPLLLVDGQQRTAAISLVPRDARPQITLSVNALAAGDSEAKKIFTIANSTQKIATDFSRALLADMDDVPPHLRRDRIPARVTQLLALKDADSPFFQLVKYPGTSSTGKPIAFNTLFLTASRFASSSLYDDEADADVVGEHLKRAYKLVKETWPDAWALKPTESKLMHAAGMRSLAEVIIDELEFAEREQWDLNDDEAWSGLVKTFRLIGPALAWTAADAGKGNDTQRENWKTQISKRQNTSQDISELTQFLKRLAKRVRKEAE